MFLLAVFDQMHVVICTCNEIFTLFPAGWQILVSEEEEQRGGEAFSWRPAPEGEPDRGARLVPGAGERSDASRGGRAAERLRPLPEDHVPVRGQVRCAVRDTLTRTPITHSVADASIQ